MSSSKKPELPRTKNRNRQGSLYKLRKTGKWVAQLPINRKRITVATGYDYEEVNAKYEKAKVELREKTYIEKDDKTIGAILEENLIEYCIIK